MKRSVTRLWAGAPLMTQFHEDWHAQWRYSQATGRMNRQKTIRILRAVDQVAKGRTTRAGRELRYLPENDAEITDTMLDERIGQLAEAEVVRRRRKGGRAGMPLPPGFVSRNLSALLKLGGEPMGTFAQILHAFRKYFELVLKRAVLTDKAIREGKITEAELEDFLDGLLGMSDQAEVDRMTAEAAAELGGFELEAEAAAIAPPVGEGDPFSLVPGQSMFGGMATALEEIIAGKDEAVISGLRPDLVQFGGTADVHLVWGDAGKGLRHIGEARGADVLAGVLQAVVRGTVGRVTPTKKTVALEHGGFTALMSLDEHGNRKSWLLTGWEEGKPDAAGKVGTSAGATQPGPTFSRAELGAGFQRMMVRFSAESTQTGAAFSIGDIDFTPGGGSKQVTIHDTTIDFGISKDGTTGEIILVRTPRTKRREGRARAALMEFIRRADRRALTLFLTPEPMDKGVTKSNLEALYLSLGFLPNKGRAKDFRSMAAMVRQPTGEAGKADAGTAQARRERTPPGTAYALTPESSTFVAYWDDPLDPDRTRYQGGTHGMGTGRGPGLPLGEEQALRENRTPALRVRNLKPGDQIVYAGRAFEVATIASGTDLATDGRALENSATLWLANAEGDAILLPRDAVVPLLAPAGSALDAAERSERLRAFQEPKVVGGVLGSSRFWRPWGSAYSLAPAAGPAGPSPAEQEAAVGAPAAAGESALASGDPLALAGLRPPASEEVRETRVSSLTSPTGGSSLTTVANEETGADPSVLPDAALAAKVRARGPARGPGDIRFFRQPGFALASAAIAESLGRQAERRIGNPLKKAEAMAQIARNMAGLRRRFQTFRLEEGGVVVDVPLEAELTPAEITAQVSAFRNQRLDELILPIWERFGALLGDDDLRTLTAQPVHSILYSPSTRRGRLMSRAAAARAGVDVKALGALWDGSEGVWTGVFGGSLMPDVALASINDALEMMATGVSTGEGRRLNSTEDLWNALRGEQESVRRRQAEYAAAREQVAEARAQALAEARAFRAKLEGRKEAGHSPKQKLLRAIATLEGILSALPYEVRAKIGGYRSLVGVSSDEGRFRVLQDRLDRADLALEEWLRKEYDKAKVDLFERAKPAKDEVGKRRVGKAGHGIHALFDVLRQATSWTTDEAIAHAGAINRWLDLGEPAPAEIQRRLADPENPTAEEEMLFEQEAAMVQLAANWINRSAADREAFILNATRLWEGGYYEALRERLLRREALAAQRGALLGAIPAANTAPARAKAMLKREGWKGRLEDLILGGLSFDGLLRWCWGESPEVLDLIDRERACADIKADAIAARQEALDRFLAGLTKAGTAFAGEKLHYDLAHRLLTVRDARTGENYQLTELNAMAATMLWAQPDGRRHMEGHKDDQGQPTGEWHYNQEFIDAIESQLSPASKALRVFLWNAYEAGFPRMNLAHRDLFGIDLARVEGPYSPVTVKQAVDSGAAALVDPVTGAAMPQASFTPSSIRIRSQAIAEPEFRDPLQTYLAHVRQTEHWIAYAKFTSDLRQVLRHRELRNAVEETSGDQANRLIGGWLQQFALGGTADAASYQALWKMIGTWTGRAARTALIGRISTVAVQQTQLGAAIVEMPFIDYIARLSKLLSGRLGWGAAFRSSYIQRRLREMPVSVQMMMAGLQAAKPTRVGHWTRKLGKLIPGADALWTAGTYAMVYDYRLELARRPRADGGLGLEGDAATAHARAEAERIVDRLAQPTRAGTRSLWENQAQNSATRIGWCFGSEARKNLGLAIYNVARGTPAQKARTLGFLFLVNGLGATLIRTALRDLRDDDDKLFDEKNWSPLRLGLASMTDPFRGFPFIGDAVSAAICAGAGQWQPSGNLFDFLGGGGQGLRNAWKLATGDRERSMENILRDVDLILSAAALPSDALAAWASLAHLAKDAWSIGANLADGED